MNSGVIDRFTDVFTRYIDSGFGLLGGEVAFLASTLIVIDVTIAGLFWAWSAEEDLLAHLIKKTLYVGFFAFLIGNFNTLAKVVFNSFSGLGLKAAGSSLSADQPSRSGYLNAVQVYPFADGALYQVYAAPGQVTDIALQEGEQLVGSGPVAAGDTVRWIIGDTESGTANARRVHILVKPTRPDVITNLVINTDRRTYHMELRSTERTYMASVSWIYPQDQLIALRRQNALAEAAVPVEANLDVDSIRFRYAIEGDNPPWRPLHAFGDGKKVYIEFPRGISQGEMPPLFIIGPEGKTSELVNYRVRGNHMVVDRLFAAAELRLGGRGSERRVRIVRTDGRLLW
jgi:type IV secretion system protein TrbG